MTLGGWEGLRGGCIFERGLPHSTPPPTPIASLYSSAGARPGVLHLPARQGHQGVPRGCVSGASSQLMLVPFPYPAARLRGRSVWWSPSHPTPCRFLLCSCLQASAAPSPRRYVQLQHTQPTAQMGSSSVFDSRGAPSHATLPTCALTCPPPHPPTRRPTRSSRAASTRRRSPSNPTRASGSIERSATHTLRARVWECPPF